MIARCGAFVAVVCLVTGLGAQAIADPASPDLTRAPYVTDLGSTYATINFATLASGVTDTSVEYGVGSGTGCVPTTVAAAPSSTPIAVGSTNELQWQTELTGLTSGTTYCYRVFADGGSIDLLGAGNPADQFTSAPAGSGTPFTFAVFGDWGEATNGSSPNQANLLHQVALSGAQFIVTSGDTAYPDGTQTEYGDLENDGGNSEIFGPQFLPATSSTMPIFSILGNHGFNDTFLANWPAANNVAASGGSYADASGNPDGWYAFSYSNVRFYLLEAAWTTGSSEYQDDYNAHWTASSAEYQWLKADLAAHPDVIKFAFFHFPYYADSSENDTDPYLLGANSLQGLLDQYGVSIGFTGHFHAYERNYPDASGMITYVTGGGGADLEALGPCGSYDAYAISYANGVGSACGSATKPSSDTQVHHFLKVTVDGDNVTVTPTDENGNTFDVQTYQLGTSPSPSPSSSPSSSPPSPSSSPSPVPSTSVSASPSQSTGPTSPMPSGVAVAAFRGHAGNLIARLANSTGPTGDLINLGGQLSAAPAVVGVGSTAWFFGTGTNHKIYVRDLHRSWQRFNPDGECLGGPGATVSGGVLTVACQGFDHRLYYSVANAGAGLPTAHGWTALGGRLAAGPAVGAPSGVVTFYAVGGGTGTGVYTRTATTGWTRRPGRCEDSPAVASDGALAYVACHGLNGGLYYAPTTAATFGNYTNLNGLLVGGPGVAVTSEGLLFCVEGRNGDLYLRTPTGPYVNDGAGPVDGAAIAGLT